MTDPLPIPPFRKPVRSAVDLPGSKSVTNRALILAALAEGPTTLSGVLFSRDTEIMIAALTRLGIEIKVDRPANTVWITGSGGSWPTQKASFEIGNAGTAARFLTALLSLHPDGVYTVDGDPPMRRRPMAELLTVLEAQGAVIEAHGEPASIPFTMRSSGLKGGVANLDAGASSQFVSALLMVAPGARKPLTIEVHSLRPAFVRMTIAMMAAFGVDVETRGKDTLHVPGGAKWQSPGEFAIEPDVTAASYFLTLPLVTGGTVLLPGLTPDLLQGDAAYAEIVQALGGRIERDMHGWTVTAEPAQGDGLDRDFRHFSDTFLTLAAITPLLGSASRIRGIEHTRKQETDRVSAVATELRKVGCTVEESPDSLFIQPNRAALAAAAEAGVEIETYEDHRFAMSFALLGCADVRGDGTPWLRIKDPACCRKTFPDFFDRLAAVHSASHI